VTLLMWAWASWWIPLLLVLGIWKHGVRRVPLTYTPMLWSLVFPLGMYALASLRLSRVTEFSPLLGISHSIIWVAVAAWIMTCVGLVAATWRHFRAFDASASPKLS
jgi:tellurite resistance protein TehA-like permease